MKFLVSILSLFLINSLNASNDLFEKANEYYKESKFDSAMQLYQAIEEQGLHSASLYYNMGNTYFKRNEIGQAVLYLERAKLLDPSNEDINHNLKYVQLRTIDKFESIPKVFFKEWWDMLLAKFSAGTWAKMSVTLLWVALALLALFLFYNRTGLKKTSFTGFSICLLMSLVFLLFSYLSNIKFEQSNYAVVTISNAYVKSAPSESSKDLMLIHEGSKVKLVEEIGLWKEVLLPDGNKGWLLSTAISDI